MANQTDSFAIFRLPHSHEIKQVRGNCQCFSSPEKIPVENAFLISPFNHLDTIFAIPFEAEESFENKVPGKIHFSGNEYPDLSREHYINLVESAVEQMQAGKFKKVVLANSAQVDIPDFEPLHFFHQIEKAYPEAFVYWFSSPQTGTWMGASPEPLLIGSGRKFKTVALAGTLANTEEVSWGEKEKEEQHWVELFVEEVLEKHELKYAKTGPFDYQSGKLIHLRTEFDFEIRDQISSLPALLSDLNPTPAVGGFPKEKAIQFIEENEHLNRSLYAGFIGLRTKEDIALFVNLRCMEWQKEKAVLFAGAGITADSHAQEEWEETQNKMKTLGNFL